MNAKHCHIPNSITLHHTFDFQRKNKRTMEVIAIEKSVLDGMNKELRELLEMTENAVQKYTPIFKEEK